MNIILNCVFHSFSGHVWLGKLMKLNSNKLYPRCHRPETQSQFLLQMGNFVIRNSHNLLREHNHTHTHIITYYQLFIEINNFKSLITNVIGCTKVLATTLVRSFNLDCKEYTYYNIVRSFARRR